MGHDANKVLMGSTQSSHKEVTNFPSVSGNVVEAGCACILESSGSVSKDTSEGSLVGISLGKDLVDTKRTAVVRKGLRVPIKLAASFNPTVGAQVAIQDDTGLAKAYTGTGDRYVNAVYVTGRLGTATTGTNGIAEGDTSDAGSVGVALIDFPGGL